MTDTTAVGTAPDDIQYKMGLEWLVVEVGGAAACTAKLQELQDAEWEVQHVEVAASFPVPQGPLLATGNPAMVGVATVYAIIAKRRAIIGYHAGEAAPAA